MRFQAGIQILLLVLAVIIAATVIRPKLAEMRTSQNEIKSYQDALDNIGAYNQRLQALISQANALSNVDRETLYRFMPTDVDETAVARDISNIVARHGLLLLDVSSEEGVPMSTLNGQAGIDQPIDPETGTFIDNSAQDGADLMVHRFTVSAVGRYQNMKEMLMDFERNVYPLRLVEFSFTVENNNDLTSYAIVLETYSLPE